MRCELIMSCACVTMLVCKEIKKGAATQNKITTQTNSRGELYPYGHEQFRLRAPGHASSRVVVDCPTIKSSSMQLSAFSGLQWWCLKRCEQRACCEALYMNFFYTYNVIGFCVSWARQMPNTELSVSKTISFSGAVGT